MGVVNVTPDSFSDGGECFDADAAVERGRTLMRTGADLIDVGGESTRPGALRVDAAEELRRVVPVVARLAADGIPVSVDTTRAEVAADALAGHLEAVGDRRVPVEPPPAVAERVGGHVEDSHDQRPHQVRERNGPRTPTFLPIQAAVGRSCEKIGDGGPTWTRG
jgi:hypothetical protein